MKKISILILSLLFLCTACEKNVNEKKIDLKFMLHDKKIDGEYLYFKLKNTSSEKYSVVYYKDVFLSNPINTYVGDLCGLSLIINSENKELLEDSLFPFQGFEFSISTIEQLNECQKKNGLLNLNFNDSVFFRCKIGNIDKVKKAFYFNNKQNIEFKAEVLLLNKNYKSLDEAYKIVETDNFSFPYSWIQDAKR